jgi:di/tripeptidase
MYYGIEYYWLLKSLAKIHKLFYYIRVMHKVRKTEHQNPEFGHTQGEIQKKTCKKVRKTQHQNPEFGHTQGEIQKKKPAKKYISIQGGVETKKTINFGGKLSFILSFIFPLLVVN